MEFRKRNWKKKSPNSVPLLYPPPSIKLRRSISLSGWVSGWFGRFYILSVYEITRLSDPPQSGFTPTALLKATDDFQDVKSKGHSVPASHFTSFPQEMLPRPSPGTTMGPPLLPLSHLSQSQNNLLTCVQTLSKMRELICLIQDLCPAVPGTDILMTPSFLG